MKGILCQTVHIIQLKIKEEVFKVIELVFEKKLTRKIKINKEEIQNNNWGL